MEGMRAEVLIFKLNSVISLVIIIKIYGYKYATYRKYNIWTIIYEAHQY